MNRPTKRQAILGSAGTAAIAVTAALTWWSLTNHTDRPHPPAPVSAIDTYRRACLLTGNDADAGTSTRVWTGMRQAATHQRLIVQRFSLPPKTSAELYLNTLTQMRCATIVTVGTTVSNAAATEHTRASRFIIVTEHSVNNARTTSLTPDQATSTGIAAILS